MGVAGLAMLGMTATLAGAQEYGAVALLKGLVRDSPHFELLVSGTLPIVNFELLRCSSRRITQWCADGTIIVIIMKLWNCRFSVTIENE